MKVSATLHIDKGFMKIKEGSSTSINNKVSNLIDRTDFEYLDTSKNYTQLWWLICNSCILYNECMLLSELANCPDQAKMF